MAKDSEQRSYSVDEMMEQLRKGEREKNRSEDAELVTRSDGSKVMRVRRRKRRSSQSAKSGRVRERRYGRLTLMGLGALVVIAGVTVVVVVARFNSPRSRRQVGRVAREQRPSVQVALHGRLLHR